MPAPPTPALLPEHEAAALVPIFADAAVIAADTEFNRSDTYRPRLCLLQLAAGERLALVDMLELTDPAPALHILNQSNSLKLFHAASQDMEALQLGLGALPNRLFDTQIGAGLLGYPAQIGYANLVEELIGHKLDKSATRTDWSRRPLSTKQLRYAAEDVTWLLQLFEILRQGLQAAGRYEWALEDSARLLDPARYQTDPGQAWQRLRGVEYQPVEVQSRIRELAAWRERRAQRIDRPRQWVLTDKALLNIAQAAPDDLASLTRVDALPPAIARRQGKHLLAALRAAGEALDSGQAGFRQLERPAPPDQAAVKRLGNIVAATASELGIAPELLATRRELSALLRGEAAPRVTSGWRSGVIGNKLLAAV